MREIKFRAWDKRKREMTTNFVMAPTSPDWSPFPIEKAELIEKAQKEVRARYGCTPMDDAASFFLPE